MKVYVYPDGSVLSSAEPSMSDDYFIIDSEENSFELVVSTVKRHFGITVQANIVLLDIAELVF